MTVASTAEEAPSLAGRWVVTALQSGVVPEKGRIFDFSPCGKKWCGVEINKDGKCGRTVFHFSPAKDAKSGYHFKGQFSPLEKAKPFTFLVLIENSKDKLWAGGDLGDVSPFQRAFPLEFEMSRQGDATCKADAKTS